jgi:hypothetical protein
MILNRDLLRIAARYPDAKYNSVLITPRKKTVEYFYTDGKLAIFHQQPQDEVRLTAAVCVPASLARFKHVELCGRTIKADDFYAVDDSDDATFAALKKRRAAVVKMVNMAAPFMSSEYAINTRYLSGVKFNRKSLPLTFSMNRGKNNKGGMQTFYVFQNQAANVYGVIMAVLDDYDVEYEDEAFNGK